MKRFSGHEEHLDTELNIVPIIDCFVMLICFLLFTGAFIQLVYLEAKLTSNTAAAAAKSRSELDQFRLVITFEDGALKLATAGNNAKPLNVTIPNVSGEYDFKTLHDHLVKLKIEYPDRFSADVEFKQKRSDAVNYNRIISLIDHVRHLSDEEYSALRTAQRKINKLELSDGEKEKVISEPIQNLAGVLLANDTTKNTDQKLLFPDVALIGIN